MTTCKICEAPPASASDEYCQDCQSDLRKEQELAAEIREWASHRFEPSADVQAFKDAMVDYVVTGMSKGLSYERLYLLLFEGDPSILNLAGFSRNDSDRLHLLVKDEEVVERLEYLLPWN